MKTFKNIHFAGRDYECTNIAFCQAESNPDESRWSEIEEGELSESTAKQLWVETANGIRVALFGWL